MKKNKKIIAIILALVTICSICVLAPSVSAEEPNYSSSVVNPISCIASIGQEKVWEYNDGYWQHKDEYDNYFSNTIATINDKQYYFDENGHMATGLQKIGGKIYLFSTTGANPDSGLGAMYKKQGFKKIDGKVYYFTNKCYLSIGWTKVNGYKYYFAPSGFMRLGFQTKGGKTYYFRETGKLGKIGRMYTGVHKIGNYKYYFSSKKGYLYKNGIYGSKKKGGYYYADKKGRINPNTRKAVKYKKVKWNVLNGKAYKVQGKGDINLYNALRLVSKVCNTSMSKAQKLRKMYNYCKTAFNECNPRIPHQADHDGWYLVYANDILANGKGNCFSYGAAFAYIAKAIGYKNCYACSSGGHGWADVNGYVCDVEWGMHHNEYSYYLMTYTEPCDVNYSVCLSGAAWKHSKV